MRISTLGSVVSIDLNRHKTIALLGLFAAFFTLLATKNYSHKNLSEIKNTLPAFSFALPGGGDELVPYPFVFVSRTHREFGSVYWDEPKDMPGVGVFSRYRDSSPGKLQVYNLDGTITTLIDGGEPSPSSMYLTDVNAPDVSYDGTKIIFAGLPQAPEGELYDTSPDVVLGAWRIFVINVDGSELTQLTFTDLELDYSQFGEDFLGNIDEYDDTDPCWLPDGRICFSSTRYPSIAQYSGVRASNLFVMNSDGTNMHRITSERNGADRPMVDPITGKIVFSRWWRNYRFAMDDMSTIPATDGYQQKDGLTMDRDEHVGGSDYLFRNAWHAASINPDGTGLQMFAGTYRTDPDNHMYGGAFTPEGNLITNYFPMYNMTEAAGFGGLRFYERGAGDWSPIIGVTNTYADYYVHEYDPTSYGIYVSDYAGEPTVAPDGRILFSWCDDVYQDYGIYIMNADGTDKTLVYDNAGTTELRAKFIYDRDVPPIISDGVTDYADPLPPLPDGPYDSDGTFTFKCLNVYFNAPVDEEIISAPPIGSANSIRFFIDQQRYNWGSFPELDWPILLEEIPVPSSGVIINNNAPANVPLFEQIRTKEELGYYVPLTGGPFKNGAAMVEGMNYGQKGTTATCVGCHAGHTMIQTPATIAEAEFTNIAPGAEIDVSSSALSDFEGYLIDRKVYKSEAYQVWRSDYGVTDNQWVKLAFMVPVKIRNVKVYNVRETDATDLQVHKITVTLYADADATMPVASQIFSDDLEETGSDVLFDDVIAQSVRIKINDVSGVLDGAACAALSEIEVIASGDVESEPTGVETVASENNFSVFPNPVDNILNLQFSCAELSDVFFEVYDAGGKQLWNWVLRNQSAGIHTIPVQAKNFAAGNYFVKCKIGDDEKTVKFVKM